METKFEGTIDFPGGSTGSQGEQGEQGDSGAQGEKGSRGKAGTSVHSRRWLALTIWVVFFTVATMYAFNTQRKLINDGRQAHTGLCAYRASLQDQVASSLKYLSDVQGGLRPRIQGVTDIDIIASIQRQRKVVTSLHSLHCP